MKQATPIPCGDHRFEHLEKCRMGFETETQEVLSTGKEVGI
jgi:hypothetical protein